MSSVKLDAMAQALAVHPRTILRLTTGLSNPYWAEGYNPDVDLDALIVILDTTRKAIRMLTDGEDKALDVHEAAKLVGMKEAEFYKKEFIPDWQVGRVKRYSLRRLAGSKQG